MPDKPFFIYFAPGATHAPASRAEGVGRTNTRASSTPGWDKLREETFARQKKLGVIPTDAHAHQAPRGDPGLGRDAGGASSRFLRARWRSTPDSSSIRTITSAGCSTR